MEETLPVTPRELWRLVMGNPDFMKSVSDTKKNRDLRIGRWRLSKGVMPCFLRQFSATIMRCKTCVCAEDKVVELIWVQHSDAVCAGDTAVRKVSYVTPFKKQVIGPKEAKAIEVYESRGIPDQGFVVDVKVHTPEVEAFPCTVTKTISTLAW